MYVGDAELAVELGAAVDRLGQRELEALAVEQLEPREKCGLGAVESAGRVTQEGFEVRRQRQAVGVDRPLPQADPPASNAVWTKASGTPPSSGERPRLPQS